MEGLGTAEGSSSENSDDDSEEAIGYFWNELSCFKMAVMVLRKPIICSLGQC